MQGNQTNQDYMPQACAACADINVTIGAPILGAMRAIWLKNGQHSSYSELMGPPKEQHFTEYWFPWYNNAVPSLLDEQFRFGVP